ncbi:MAG TPA: cytochrome P460 family protein [Gemmatimonadota bacterium]|nr:cytochrome P460 family protein [Gemmatimonadota bacterium]
MIRWTTILLPAAIPLFLGVGACGRAGGGPDAAAAHPEDSIPAAQLPRFTPDGRLLRPEGWEGWVLAGTSMGLTYNEPAAAPAPGAPPGIFLNVYVQPWAYERFMESGEFPEGTMFILAMAEPITKADPARGGFYMGEISMMEVHLKRAGVHESGWGFYGFGSDDSSAEILPAEANCYSCHRDEAAYDQAFVQFYPKMRERLGLDPAVADSTARPAGESPADGLAPGGS